MIDPSRSRPVAAAAALVLALALTGCSDDDQPTADDASASASVSASADPSAEATSEPTSASSSSEDPGATGDEAVEDPSATGTTDAERADPDPQGGDGGPQEGDGVGVGQVDGGTGGGTGSGSGGSGGSGSQGSGGSGGAARPPATPPPDPDRPAQVTPQQGETVVGLYLARGQDALEQPLVDARQRASDVGYQSLPGDVTCDRGAREALGLQSVQGTFTVESIYFRSVAEAERARALYGRDVLGIATIQAFCQD